jgi:hypothetical protein
MSRSPALVRNELIVPGRHNERVGDPERLRRLLREQAGLDLAALREADGGQSGSTYLATGSDGTPSVLKVGPNAGQSSANTVYSLGKFRSVTCSESSAGGPMMAVSGSPITSWSFSG